MSRKSPTAITPCWVKGSSWHPYVQGQIKMIHTSKHNISEGTWSCACFEHSHCPIQNTHFPLHCLHQAFRGGSLGCKDMLVPILLQKKELRFVYTNKKEQKNICFHSALPTALTTADISTRSETHFFFHLF